MDSVWRRGKYDNEQFFEDWNCRRRRGESGFRANVGRGRERNGHRERRGVGRVVVRHERKAPNGENLEKGAHRGAVKVGRRRGESRRGHGSANESERREEEAKEAKRLAKLAEEKRRPRKNQLKRSRRRRTSGWKKRSLSGDCWRRNETSRRDHRCCKASSEAMDATVSGDDTVPPPPVSAAVDADANSDDDSDDDIEAQLEIDESGSLPDGPARIKGWKNRIKKPNAYYYRFNAPGERQANGGWTPKEHEQFMDTLAKLPDGKANYEWGRVLHLIPGRNTSAPTITARW